jgi:hypothetical protein
MSAKEIQQTFAFLSQHAGKLSNSQLEFAKGLFKFFQRNRQLSERQLKVLLDLKKLCL